MDQLDEMLQKTNEEIKVSLKLVQELANELTRTTEIVNPALEKHIKDLRSARMTVVNEVTTILGQLREVRMFFIESDHRKEVERLEEFVRLCERIKVLKQDGTLEAICESILRLAVAP